MYSINRTRFERNTRLNFNLTKTINKIVSGHIRLSSLGAVFLMPFYNGCLSNLIFVTCMPAKVHIHTCPYITQHFLTRLSNVIIIYVSVPSHQAYAMSSKPLDEASFVLTHGSVELLYLLATAVA